MTSQGVPRGGRVTARDTDDTLLEARARLAKLVVYRALARETVILDLNSCRYHGLNPTAERMLHVLQQSATVREAAGALALEFEVSPSQMTRDVMEFCRHMLRLGLLECSSPEGA